MVIIPVECDYADDVSSNYNGHKQCFLLRASALALFECDTTSERNKKAKIVIGRHNDVLEVIRAVIVSGIKLERPAGKRGNYTPLCPTINATNIDLPTLS